MKYKLLKDYPHISYVNGKLTVSTIKPNSIYLLTGNNNYYYKVNDNTNSVLNKSVVEDNKEWFAKLLGISEDNVEIYEGDTVYFNNYQDKEWVTEKLDITEETFDFFKDENIKVFTNEKAAEDYRVKVKKSALYPKSINDLKNIETVYGLYSEYLTLSHRDRASAFSKLMKLHKTMIHIYNKENNCKWQPDWTGKQINYKIVRVNNNIIINSINSEYNNTIYNAFPFPTLELAEFSLQNHKDLWEQYYEL